MVLTPLVDKGVQAGLDMKSPYLESTLRTGRLLMAGVSDPASADDVADVIWHAISTDTPKLRYQVGTDAKAIAAQRPALTDEEWIAGLTMVDDEQWRANMKAWSATKRSRPGLNGPGLAARLVAVRFGLVRVELTLQRLDAPGELLELGVGPIRRVAQSPWPTVSSLASSPSRIHRFGF